MVREICKDEVFLAQKAEIATVADMSVADDLLETLISHKDRGIEAEKLLQLRSTSWLNYS